MNTNRCRQCNFDLCPSCYRDRRAAAAVQKYPPTVAPAAASSTVFAALQALLDADAHGVAQSQQEASRARVAASGGGGGSSAATSDGAGVEMKVGLGNCAAAVAASSADSFECGCSVVMAPSHAARLSGPGVSPSLLPSSSKRRRSGRWDSLPMELAMCDADAVDGDVNDANPGDGNEDDEDDEAKDALEAAMVFSSGTLAAVQASSSSSAPSPSWHNSGGSVSLNRAVKLLCSLRRLVEAEATAPANAYALAANDKSSSDRASSSAAAAATDDNAAESSSSSPPTSERVHLQQLSAALLSASWVWQSPSLEVKLAQQLQPLAVVTGAVSEKFFFL